MSMWRPLFLKCMILDHKLQRMLNASKIAQLNSERPLHQTAVPPGWPFQGKKLYRLRPAHTLTYLTLCQPVPSNKNYFDCVYGHGAHFVKRSKSIPEIKAFVLPKYSSDVVLSIIKLHFASSHVLINFRPFFLILFLDCEPPSSGGNFLTDFVIGH